MTNRRIVLSIVLLTATLIGVQQIYADHPLTHGYNEHTTWSYYTPETNTYTTVQTWSYTPNEMEKKLIEDGFTSMPEVIEEIVEEPEPEVERLNTSDPKQVMQFYTDRLQQKLDDGKIRPSEEELLKMLNSVMIKCYLGVEEGKPIQKFAEFIIPTYEPDVSTDLSNKWLLGQLLKKQQECDGWDAYKETWLGQQYLDIETENINKAEIIKQKLLEKYPSDFTDPVTQRDLDDENDDAHRVICTSTLWGDALKKDSGCLTAEISVGGTVPFSTQGEKIMEKWQRYQNTGELDVPKPKPESEPPDRESVTRQYLEALGYTSEEVEAAVAALKDGN